MEDNSQKIQNVKTHVNNTPTVSPEVTPVPEQKEIKKQEKKKHLIRPIRTYKDDVARFVKNGKITTSKIVLAEQKRRQERARKSQVADALAQKKQARLLKKVAKGDRNAQILAAQNEADLERKRLAEMTEEERAAEELAKAKSPDTDTSDAVVNVMPKIPGIKKPLQINWAKPLMIFFILVGIAAITSTFILFDPIKMVGDLFTGNTQSNSRFNDNGEIIDGAFIKDRSELHILTDGMTSTRIKNIVIQNIDTPPETEKGSVVEIKLIETVETVVQDEKLVDVVTKISSEKFMSIMELNAPDYMVRSFDPTDYLFGIINLGPDSEATPFLLFRTTDFDRVFSGLLEWEVSMYRDVNDIFFKTLGTNDFVVSNSDAGFDPNSLQDVTISNRDARAIVNDNQEILFFYTFLNNDYLLMTSKKGVVDELVRKLTLQNLVR